MSASAAAGQPRKVVPAQLGFLAIYNPSLGTTDETFENQIVYYSSSNTNTSAHLAKDKDPQATEDRIREQSNEQLRQIGLAQGMVEFGRSFSDGKAVDTVETEKSRIILHELEAGWWILASITLTILPGTANTPAGKGKSTEQQEAVEYSSREVKPAILLLGDLLRAHATFLLHHASSLSALFVRTRRSKFVGILGRYWDIYLSTWNVLMHGNPANNLYGGIKMAACGELGVGVGEEERGSGERDVLEGFVGRIEGLVDVIVSKFGDGDPIGDSGDEMRRKVLPEPQSSGPWLGSGNEPAAEDGVIFLGTGALSRKSLRDVSHWMEDLYRWGTYAYGVVDNPSSNRRTKRAKHKQPNKPKELSQEAKEKARQVYGLNSPDKKHLNQENFMTTPIPAPIYEVRGSPPGPKSGKRRPSLRRGSASLASLASSESDSSKGNKFIHYLKLGYGTHWSLGGTASTTDDGQLQEGTDVKAEVIGQASDKRREEAPIGPEGMSANSPHSGEHAGGHYLIGLLGDVESDQGDPSRINSEPSQQPMNMGDSNARLLLRTLTLELEREEDARAEADISIDLGNDENERPSSKLTGSEHTGTSNTSFESQDRNKTKKLRVVVYVHKPFVFVLLFELRADALAWSSLYHSLHHQIGPLVKPLLTSTTYRVSKPEVTATDNSTTPIYDLVWDPKLLTINSTIPNIPDPILMHSPTQEFSTWSRVEALNTHMQIINTYIASSTDRSELERTCKTSRGWWVVWTRVPDLEPPRPILASGPVRIPGLIAEDSIDSQESDPFAQPPNTSRGTSTFLSSMNSGPAHPFLEPRSNGIDVAPKDKEIFLIRRASDYVAATRSTGRYVGAGSNNGSEGWISGPGRLAQGIGVDTKRYIEGLLNLNR